MKAKNFGLFWWLAVPLTLAVLAGSLFGRQMILGRQRGRPALVFLRAWLVWLLELLHKACNWVMGSQRSAGGE